MTESNSAQFGGIGICGMLTLIFVVLKVSGNFAHSWWWVASPLWIPCGLVAGVAGILIIFGLIAVALERIYQWATR